MFPWPTSRDLGWGRASCSKGEVSLILPQTTSCAPEPCLLQPGFLPPLTSSPLPFTQSQFGLPCHACMHSTYAFGSTKGRGRCWAWVEDQMWAAHPLRNCPSHASSVRVHWGRRRVSRSRRAAGYCLLGNRWTSRNLMDCFYSISCHKTHFLGGMLPSLSSS